MYNLTVHAHQSLQHSIVLVSCTETDDTSHTETVFTAHAHMDGSSVGEDVSDLEIFLDQTIRGIVKALSMSEPQAVLALETVSQSTVGGGAPGHPGQTERSEDDHA